MLINRFGLLRSAVAITVFVAAAGAASAATIGYTATDCAVTAGNIDTPVGSNCLSAQVTNFSYDIRLPEFNPALGTLTGVTLYFYESTDVVTLEINNQTNGAGQLWAIAYTKPNAGGTNTAVSSDNFHSESLTLYDSTNGSNESANPSTFGSCADGDTPQGGCTGGMTLGVGVTSANLGGYSYANTSSLYTSDSGYPSVGTGLKGVTGTYLTDIANALKYEGTGSFDLKGTASTFGSADFTTGGGSGTTSVTRDITTLLNAEVDYTYTPAPVPEPATCGLFGSALAGLIVFRKRFKR
jgi:PEP-CTERM motif